MPEPEPTDDELLAQAAACPLIRGAYTTGETSVIAYIEAIHPPSRCQHVKAAAEQVRRT
jgi:hypothetical protein